MSLSRAERRELARIDQSLSRESELAELAALFSQTPDDAGSAPEAARARRRLRVIAASFVVAAAGVVGGCLVGAMDRPAATAIGAVLVVCSGLGLAVVLIRYASR